MKKVIGQLSFFKWIRDLGIIQKWTIRKMVFVAILISISVAFTIISAQLVPIIALPTYKVSFLGLPIKITGFIFGPLIGGFVGLVSDLLSLIFIPPATYNPLYTLAATINGVVSGIFGWFFIRFLNYAFGVEFRVKVYSAKIQYYGDKYKLAVVKNDEKLINKYASKVIYFNNKRTYVKQYGTISMLKNINMIVGMLFLLIIIAIIVWYIGFVVKDDLIQRSLIKDRRGILALMLAGISSQFFMITISRFKMKSSTYLKIVPIIIFSGFLELINVPILSFADLYALGSNDNSEILLWILQHVISSPLKIWFNIFVIYYSYTIISKLINKNKNLSYK